MKRILILLLILVFISGCVPTEEEKEGAFVGGTEGISVEFKDIAPPSEFNQGEDVPVKVILKNNGEYDVVSGNAKAKIYGINLNDFGLSGEYKGNIGLLKGKGEFLEEGGEQEISFGELNYIQDVTNSRDFTIRSKVCYPYQTRAEVEVCIKSATSEEAGETICSLAGEKVVSGSVSGAPIQITSLTEKTRGSNQVRFDITIENEGGGNVYSEDVSCEDLDDDMIRLNNDDKLTLEVISPLDVLCSFKTGEDSNVGVIELDNNMEKVSCWMDAEDVYEDILKISLRYMYTDTTSKQITIYEV